MLCGILICFFTTFFSLSVPMTLFMSAKLNARCGMFSLVLLCYVRYMKANTCFLFWNTHEYRYYGKCWKSLFSLNDWPYYIFFCSWSLVCWTLHRSLMAHSTPHSLQSDPVCDPYVCQHQKTHVQTSRWPLQSGPWCYLQITTCHPSTGKPLGKRTSRQTYI